MASFAFPVGLGLPASTVGTQASQCESLWSHDEEDVMAVAGAIHSGLVPMSPLGHEAVFLAENEQTAILAAHTARTLGYVQAVKMHNNAEYRKLVQVGRTLGNVEEPTYKSLM